MIWMPATPPRPDESRLSMTLSLRALMIALSLLIGAGAQAQNLFAPVASIDGRVVTAFELDQRARMLSLFRAPGDPREEAMRALVDERLQLIEGERAGITISDEELMTGMEEFAGRANLTVDEFLQSLSAQGIDATTYEDFVRAGIVWRRIVRDRFGSLGRNVTDDDVAARLRAPPRPGLRVLLSELIIPANTPEAAARAQALAPQIGAISSVAAFSAAAREYSAAPTREAGGQLEWLELENLPAPIRAAIQGLRPGQVSAPLALPNALAFFQLRATEESPAQAPVRSLDYAAFYFPAGPEGQATLGELTTRVQTCEDLYAFAQGLPPSRLQRDRLAPPFRCRQHQGRGAVLRRAVDHQSCQSRFPTRLIN